MVGGAVGERGRPAAGVKWPGVDIVATRHQAAAASRAEGCSRSPPSAFKVADVKEEKVNKVSTKHVCWPGVLFKWFVLWESI